jgi:hypothetical protein
MPNVSAANTAATTIPDHFMATAWATSLPGLVRDRFLFGCE